jgi:hypothetical protein
VCMYHTVTVFDIREYGHLYVIDGATNRLQALP